MDVSDREGIALLGAHSCGKCHADISGIDGYWISPIRYFLSLDISERQKMDNYDYIFLSNDYYVNLIDNKYVYETKGNQHYYKN